MAAIFSFCCQRRCYAEVAKRNRQLAEKVIAPHGARRSFFLRPMKCVVPVLGVERAVDGERLSAFG